MSFAAPDRSSYSGDRNRKEGNADSSLPFWEHQCHFFRSLPNSTSSSHLPPANYSFKVVFRVFRDFHSVPVKPHLCSSWSILYIQSQNRSNVPTGTFSTMFQREHSVNFFAKKTFTVSPDWH